MELDTQVEEPVLPDSLQTEHKRKHKSKDKHKNKHKHHKKPRRDRTSTDAGDLPGEDSGQVKVAALGFEDGELPGAPAAARDSSPLLTQANVPETISAEHHASIPAINIRNEHENQPDPGKLDTPVDFAASHDHTQPQQPVQPASTIDSAGAAADQRDHAHNTVHHAHSRSSREPDIPSHNSKPHHTREGCVNHSRPDKDRQRTDKHSHSSSHQTSERPRHDSHSSRHRSSSRRPSEAGHDAQHRSSHRVSHRESHRDSRTGHDSHRSSQTAAAAIPRTDSRRPDRTDSRYSDRDSRQHHREKSAGPRPHDRRYDRPYDRSYDRRDDRLHRPYDRERGEGRDRDRERAGDRDKRKRDDKEEKEAEQEFVAKVEAALKHNDVDEDRLIEERRRRRQEILAKHQQEAGNGAAPATSISGTSGPSAGSPKPSVPIQPSPSRAMGPTAQHAEVARSESVQSMQDTAQTAHVDVLAELPPEGAVERAVDGAASPSISDDEQYQKLDGASLWQQGQGQAASNGMPAGTVPAADAEPEVQQASMDDREVPKQAAQETQEAAAAVPVRNSDPGGFDMFADGIDADMFSDAPVLNAAVAPEKKALLDNYDDAEGYYNFQVGEIMDGRYEVFATHGKGVFSSVLRARDKHNPVPGTEVAIKMIRSNETMYKAAQTEKVVLRKLAGADPDGRRHCIKLLRTFEYRSHLCLVFEAMDINLRELTKKYGRGIGLNIAAVSKYAAQMLISLYHLRNCGVLHADIKPDNILVSASRTMVKLADFGSAMFSGDNEITPYLVSRFYRAPEVILGLKYDHALDIWSVGCVIYELFTGAILFPGQTNNQMLKLMMDVKGPFPKKMLKKGVFTDRHFEDDPNMSFALLEEDQVTRRPIRRTIAAPHVKKDFAGLLAGSEGERKKISQLADLLERMMALDPDKRITPKDALKHAFIKEAK